MSQNQYFLVFEKWKHDGSTEMMFEVEIDPKKGFHITRGGRLHFKDIEGTAVEIKLGGMKWSYRRRGQ